MIEDFLIPLVVVGLAELGDKTQLSILLLSSRIKNHFHLLAGVMLGFLVVDGIAIAIGSWISNLVSADTLKLVSGLVFIGFGVLMLLKNGREEADNSYSGNGFLTGFALISLTEWGDKTQIAAGLFATKYNALLVLAGAMLALAILSAAAIYVGRIISSKIERKVTTKVAGAIFILLGLSSFLI